MSVDIQSYPSAPERPVQEHMGGIAFMDPYEWLEEDSPETLAWQAAQNDLAVRHLHSWEGYELLKQRLAAYSGREVTAPHRAGDCWFRLTPADTPEGRAVLRDIDSWAPRLAPGAIVGGDDYNWRSVAEGVTKRFADVRVMPSGCVWWTKLPG